jgi:hypothetical protein
VVILLVLSAIIAMALFVPLELAWVLAFIVAQEQIFL